MGEGWGAGNTGGLGTGGGAMAGVLWWSVEGWGVLWWSVDGWGVVGTARLLNSDLLLDVGVVSLGVDCCSEGCVGS